MIENGTVTTGGPGEKVTGASPPQGRRSGQQYVNNMLVEECLEFLPQAVEYPEVGAFLAFLREHLHHNSAVTRQRYAEYISGRYSRNGRMNLALARFLKFCPHDRSRREVLWYETVQAMPALRDLCEFWLAKIPSTGTTRPELIDFLTPRVAPRNPDKIAKEAVSAIRKFGHLKNLKIAVYQAVWTDPPLDALAYVLSRQYPAPAVARMEAFKNEPLWQALLWPAVGLERLVTEAERSGEIARVTRLDNYYQFALEGTGAERLNALLAKWGDESGVQA